MAREDGLEPAVGVDGCQMKLFKRMADGGWRLSLLSCGYRPCRALDVWSTSKYLNVA